MSCFVHISQGAGAIAFNITLVLPAKEIKRGRVGDCISHNAAKVEAEIWFRNPLSPVHQPSLGEQSGHSRQHF